MNADKTSSIAKRLISLLKLDSFQSDLCNFLETGKLSERLDECLESSSPEKEKIQRFLDLIIEAQVKSAVAAGILCKQLADEGVASIEATPKSSRTVDQLPKSSPAVNSLAERTRQEDLVNV